MKESRLFIIVFSIAFILLGPILFFIYSLFPNLIDYLNVGTNLYCGLIVALITSICEFYSAKRRIINSIYNSYFDLYKTFYFVNNNSFMGHFNSLNVSNKLIEITSKINESMDEYHGLFKRQDKTYKKINQPSGLTEDYDVGKIIESLRKWFNKKTFTEGFEPLINMSIEILNNIDKKRFEKDKKNMMEIMEKIEHYDEEK